MKAQKFPKLPPCIKVKHTTAKLTGIFPQQLLNSSATTLSCKRCAFCRCDLSPSPGKHLHTKPTAAAPPARLPGLQSRKMARYQSALVVMCCRDVGRAMWVLVCEEP
ncbi:hypothetical protein PAMP_016673 [Pampus punctatissimus]